MFTRGSNFHGNFSSPWINGHALRLHCALLIPGRPERTDAILNVPTHREEDVKGEEDAFEAAVDLSHVGGRLFRQRVEKKAAKDQRTSRDKTQSEAVEQITRKTRFIYQESPVGRGRGGDSRQGTDEGEELSKARRTKGGGEGGVGGGER